MTDAFSRQQVRAMEQAAARAWPAGGITDVAGWQVRLSGGGSRRANSVLPLQYTGSDLATDITAVEAHYRVQNTRSYFLVTSIAEPPQLDAELERRGYTYEEPCLLLAKPLQPSAMPDGVVLSEHPTEAWLSVYGESIDPVRYAALPAVLAAVPSPRAFLLVMRDGAPLSSALAVASPDGFVLVECVATRQAARKSGGGTLVMDALESWAAARGVHTSVLQVIEGNTPARALYGTRGYAEAGRYHYRWRDVV